METRTPQNVIFILIFIFFSPPTVTSQRDDAPPGDIPILNPTTPGTTPTSPPTTTSMGPPTITMGPPTTTSPTTSGSGSWCIASSSASETALQVALDYACGYGGADCSAIQPNGACYNPSTIRDHASYAFNDYYQKNPGPTSCAFGGAAQLTNTDPSNGNCHFASSSGTQPTPPVTNTPPTLPMPPSGPYPPLGSGNVPYPSQPTGDNGSEPTGSPNSPTLPMPPPSTTTQSSPYTQLGSGNTPYPSQPTGDNGSEPTSTPSSPTLPMSPPSTTTQSSPYPPLGSGNIPYPSQPSGDYGSEPTGTPSSAQIMSLNLLLLITVNCLLLSVSPVINF